MTLPVDWAYNKGKRIDAAFLNSLCSSVNLLVGHALLRTDWEDYEGMQVDAAFFNTLDAALNGLEISRQLPVDWTNGQKVPIESYLIGYLNFVDSSVTTLLAGQPGLIDRVVVNPVRIQDSTSKVSGRNLINPIGITGATSAVLSTSPSPLIVTTTSAIGIHDSVNVAASRFVSFTNAFGIHDSATRAAGRTFTNALGIASNTVKTATRSISNSVGITGAASAVLVPPSGGLTVPFAPPGRL